jgi:protein-S-isoprenylcysteine O-methyltransferase Ste14
MSGLELKVPPPIVALVAGLLMWAVARWLPTLCNLPRTPLLIPVLLAVLAAGSTAAGMIAFRRQGTTVNPLQPSKSTSLVTGGIYRVTRNPMYLGLALVLLGWALVLCSLPAWLGPVVFVAYITRFQIIPEERALATLFGAGFIAYRARVRRWL